MATGALPTSDLELLCGDVFDQGQAPFCFANATSKAIEICLRRDNDPSPEPPSRLELVYFAHALEGDVNAFDGAFISDVFEAIEKLGFAPERLWPYSDSQTGNYRVRPSESLIRQSYDQISLNYPRILTAGNQRVRDVANALAEGNPVVFGTDVTDAFAANQLGPDFTYDVPGGGGDGHAMTAIGREPDGRFKIRNSWGPDWGERGNCYFTEDVIAWNQTRELYIVDFKRAVAA